MRCCLDNFSIVCRFAVPFAPHSQQTVSSPIANLRSLSAAVKSLRRCRGPLGCKLYTGFHSTTSAFLGACVRRPPVLGHFWYPLFDKCFGTPWNAGSRTPVPASGARLHVGDANTQGTTTATIVMMKRNNGSKKIMHA